MKLIGQYDSPFVRRVAVAMQFYDLAYEHLPWSTFSDKERLIAFNPLIRVPVLVLGDGEAIIDSGAILDHLDQMAGPERALIPARGKPRRDALNILTLAGGLADKAVSLVYFRLFAGAPDPAYLDRCDAQITGALAALERLAQSRSGPWWNGSRPGHADIFVATATRFVSEAYPGRFGLDDCTALGGHCRACEAMPQFSAVQQSFVPPA